MARFRLSTLHIVFTVIAVWLSTLAGYGGSEDVRAFIMLGCLIASGVAALSCTAHRRAFWLGFFGTMLATATRGIMTSYGASFKWAEQVSINLSQYITADQFRIGRVVTGINLTIVFALTLVVATLIGLVSLYVYDQAKRP